MTKYLRYRAEQPTVTSKYPTLRPDLDRLAVRQDAHFDVVNRLCGVNLERPTTPMFEHDFVLLSILNRSLDLIDGFLATFDRWNLSTAAPQVRMQVDNVLRLNLLYIAPPHSVSTLLLSGEPLRRHIDPLSADGSKEKLTDLRLRDHARPNFPWLDAVYVAASGWVHFSSVHVGTTIRVGDDGSFASRFPSDIERYPYDFLEQVLWAMNEASQGVLDLASWFAEGKEQAASGWSEETDVVPPSNDEQDQEES